MLTQRQEAFALNLFKGLTQRESWIQAGYSDKYALKIIDKHACELANKGKIKGRLAELHAETNGPDIATVEERKKRLTEFLRAQLVDFTDENNEPVLSRDVPNHGAAREYYHRTKIDKLGNPTITKSIKLVDPISAITELNKMERIYETAAITNIDNRQVNIYVREEKTKQLLQRVSARTKKLELGSSPPE